MYLMLDIRATGLSGEAFAHRLLRRSPDRRDAGRKLRRAAAGHLRVALTIDDEALLASVGTLADLYERLAAEAA